MPTKLTVFISSSMVEFSEERTELYHHLQNLRFPDYPNIEFDPFVYEISVLPNDNTPRGEFLLNLQKSKLYIGLFWKKIGEWTKEEYDHAVKWGIESHVYIRDQSLKKEDRSSELNNFLNTVGDVEAGKIEKYYQTVSQLIESVDRAIENWLERYMIRPRSDMKGYLLQNVSDVQSYVYRSEPNSTDERDFIGRTKLLNDGLEKLATTKYVLLRGLGGSGKTALAIEIASIKVKEGNVVWLRAGREDAEGLISNLTRTFSKNDGVDKSLKEYLLANDVRLIVLDSVWSSNDSSDREKLSRIIRELPDNVQLLVTSREQLKTFRGVSLDLSADEYQLSIEDSLKILNKYSNRDLESEGSADKLCERLHFHVFSLRLAGIYLLESDRPPQELLNLLDREVAFESSAGDLKEIVVKHQKKLIDLSYEALKPTASSILQAFVNIFTHGATQGLVECYLEEINAIEISDSLIEIFKSGLLEQSKIKKGTKKFQLLYYSIHDIVLEYMQRYHNSSDRNEKVVDACRKYVVQNTQKGREDFHAINIELPNLLRAAQVSDEILGLLAESGYFESFSLKTDTPKMWDINPEPARNNKSYLLTLFENAIHAAETRKDQSAVHYLASQLGDFYMRFDEDGTLGFNMYLKALETAPTPDREIHLLCVVSVICAQSGMDGADNYILKAEQLAEAHTDSTNLITVSRAKGQIARARGQYDAAQRYFDEAKWKALDVRETNLAIDGDYLGIVIDLADIEIRLDDYHKGLQFAQEAYALAKDKNIPIQQAYAAQSIGEAHHRLGNKKEAQDTFEEALKLYKENGSISDFEELEELMQNEGYITHT